MLTYSLSNKAINSPTQSRETILLILLLYTGYDIYLLYMYNAHLYTEHLENCITLTLPPKVFSILMY
jgi:hypothetical protein